MARLDKDYYGIGNFLGGFPASVYFAFINNDLTTQMQGAFQPLADMHKDLVNTVQPYRLGESALKDAAKPFYGIANCLKGIAYLIAVIPLFLFNLIACIFVSKNPKDWAYKAFVVGGNLAISWLIDGLLSLVQGVTRIAAAPLNWFVKMPLRGLIRAYYYFNDDPQTKKFLLAENRPSIQALVTEAKEWNEKADDNWTSNENLTCNSLQEKIFEKYKKSILKGEPSSLNQEKVERTYNRQHLYTPDDTEIKKTSIKDWRKQYFALFQPDPMLKEESENKEQTEILKMM